MALMSSRLQLLLGIPSLRNIFAPRTLATTGNLFGKKKKWIVPTNLLFAKIDHQLKRDGKEHKIKRSQLSNWNFEMELKTFSNRLNENFDLALLKQAMVDTSYVVQESIERDKLGLTDASLVLNSNEELASIGNYEIVNYSYKYLQSVYPLLPEEGLSSLVEYLSSEEVTAHIGKNLGLKDLILTVDFLPSDSSYSTCFKAVVGALKNSSELEKVHLFIRDFVVTQLCDKEIIDIWQITNAFVTLQDILKRSGRSPAEPRLLNQGAPATIEANYEVGIYCDQQIIGRGHGETVSTAVELASLNVLQRIFKIHIQRRPLPIRDGPKNLSSTLNTMDINNFKIDKQFNIFTISE